MKKTKRIILFTLILSILIIASKSYASRKEVVEYELTIARNEVDINGKTAEGMTINGGIPGPVLYFKEGDIARIHVHNDMDVDTSIHWHGLLVPPGMDGVPYISFPPIKAHSTFTYEFPIRQSGTYWYHSHTSLQEQKGVYGAFVIANANENINYEKEHTIVLSDWTVEDPHEVLRTLKRGSHWFTVQKGSAQSLFGAAKAGMLWDYFKRELQRMPVMDISDVAYDNFLANGKPEMYIDAKPGDKIRLRIVDGSSTTFFHLNFAGGPMIIISADGLPVEPLEQDRFLIAVAETYDVLIKIPDKGMYELRATAHDASGFSSIWIGEGEKHYASKVPPPNIYESMGKLSFNKMFALTPAGSMGMSDFMVKEGKFDKPGMMGSMMKMHSKSSGHDIMSHKKKVYSQNTEIPEREGKEFSYDFKPMISDVSSRGKLVKDGSPERPWPPYNKLKAVEKTAFPKDLPVREIRLTLDGDMERYVWFINNKPLSESDVIRINANEITRFILINRTMMHHPMHLHGQFFRVINGKGDYAPLKHTVDVEPMSTTVFEVNGSETGDWFFHCHLLYHMESGMARVVHYDGFEPPEDVQKIRKKLYKEKWYAWAQADGLSNMTQGYVNFSDTRNIFKAKWEVGWQEVEEIGWENVITYERFLNRFLTLFAGADLEGEGNDFHKKAGIFGFHYVLPLNLEFSSWVDTDGEGRFMLEREIALTPRLELFGEVEYDTLEKWEGKTGLAYNINLNFSIIGQWHSKYGWGGGARIRF